MILGRMAHICEARGTAVCLGLSSRVNATLQHAHVMLSQTDQVYLHRPHVSLTISAQQIPWCELASGSLGQDAANHSYALKLHPSIKGAPPSHLMMNV